MALLERTQNGATSLERKAVRSSNRFALSKVEHVGRTLYRLDREERKLVGGFEAISIDVGTERDPFAWVNALSMLIRALDTVRERRRIILGIPLPKAGTREPLELGPGDVKDAQLIGEGSQPGYNGQSDSVQCVVNQSVMQP